MAGSNQNRVAELSRETGETRVLVKVDLDGTGKYEINTSVKYFTHMLELLSKHSKIDMKIESSGDLEHHEIEDVGIVLGKAIRQALGDKKGIYRFGEHFMAMDESLARCVIDISGRSYYIGDLRLRGGDIEGMKVEDIEHFFLTFTQNLQANIHVHVLYGANDHHQVEAAIKSLALAIRQAIQIDDRSKNDIPSTKGILEKE
ncbi:MAG: imidazoleglycerol-phosphate dehydratase HisB [Promethearchaeota archaeon]